MLQKKHKIHFVGIGGIGMSGIAEVLLNSGYVVTGSDLQESEVTRRLRALGARVFVGHQEVNLAGNPSVVVISTAVKYSNPEVLEARRRHIPVIPRAEMLAELMRMKYGVAVAGSHGKTTTTSMIAAVLSTAGLDPTMVIGGRVHMLGTNARRGQGEFLVAEADFSAQDLKMTAAGVGFTLLHHGKSLGDLHLNLPGRHSATNALAAAAVAHELEIPFFQVAEALGAFTGIHRRFEVKGEPRGIMVIDDYGHHPTEIRATIGAIRDSWKRPLTVIFQPHRFTRTRDLFDEFLTAFEGADRLVLTEIYPAGEDPIAGITGEALYQAIKRKGHLDVEFIPDKSQIVAPLAEKLSPGEIALTLGAGDIYKIGEALVEALK